MRRTLLTARKFTVDRLQMVSPAGRTVDWEVVVHPGAVVILPILDDGSVVMIRNFRPASGETLLELPAGTLEADETPVDCAARELEEETGYAAARIEPLCAFFTSPGILTERMHAFVATGLSEVGQSLEEGEEIEVQIVPIDEVRQLLTDGRLRDVKTIAVLGTHLLRLEAR